MVNTIPPGNLSPEAHQVVLLMSAGWELHLYRNRKVIPTLWKKESSSGRLEVKLLDISFDTVIDIERAVLIKTVKTFRSHLGLATVFSLI